MVGLLRDRDLPADRWAAAAERLGRTLLEPAVADLPRGIKRIVVVPDGDLHALPFEALTTVAGSPRFGQQFDLMPSATLWLHLRRRQTDGAIHTAPVFADPHLGGGTPVGGRRLGPLPWARREAHAIARALQLGAPDERFYKALHVDHRWRRHRRGHSAGVVLWPVSRPSWPPPRRRSSSGDDEEAPPTREGIARPTSFIARRWLPVAEAPNEGGQR